MDDGPIEHTALDTSRRRMIDFDGVEEAKPRKQMQKGDGGEVKVADARWILENRR